MNRHKSYQPKLAYVDDMGKLIVCHDSGFFSCCTIRLRKIINYYNDYKNMPVVDSSRQWGRFYKDEPGDITNKLFKLINVDLKHRSDVLFSTDTVEDQFSDYSKINYEDVNTFVQRYFTISDDTTDIVNTLTSKYNIDFNNTIAVCYRGSDKRTETRVPSHEEMINEMQLIKTQYPECKILLQTDEIEFLELAKQVFPDIIYFEETSKVTSNSRATQFYFQKGEKLNNAILFLAVMKILSSSKYVIMNSGNVGMWICLLRGTYENVKQIR